MSIFSPEDQHISFQFRSAEITKLLKVKQCKRCHYAEIVV